MPSALIVVLSVCNFCCNLHTRKHTLKKVKHFQETNWTCRYSISGVELYYTFKQLKLSSVLLILIIKDFSDRRGKPKPLHWGVNVGDCWVMNTMGIILNETTIQPQSMTETLKACVCFFVFCFEFAENSQRWALFQPTKKNCTSSKQHLSV